MGREGCAPCRITLSLGAVFGLGDDFGGRVKGRLYHLFVHFKRGG